MMQIKELSAGYGGHSVIENISLDFPAGKITGIIGPNGCGKSTLLKTCARQNGALSGKILLDGRDISGFGHKEFARAVAFLPQSRDAAAISVQSLVSHGRFPYSGFARDLTGEDTAHIEAAMELTGTAGLRHSSVSELSGGQRQKVYLATCIAQSSSVMLLDEPTTFLDIGCQLEMLELITRLRDAGRAIAMVIHDLGLAMRYCDTLLLMDKGRAAAFGAPEAVEGDIERVFKVNCKKIVEGGKAHYFYYI